MSILATHNQVRSRQTNRTGNIQPNYGASSISKRSQIITTFQTYDNYYGKVSVQKQLKNPLASNIGNVYNMPSYNKDSGMLPKISSNESSKKQEERQRVLYSRQKNNKRQKQEYYTSSMAQSQGRRNADIGARQVVQSSKQYIRNMPEERQTPFKQSKQDLQQIFKSKTLGLVGLNNIGNTCFMNSILQCMLNLPKFNDYFLGNNHLKQGTSAAKVAVSYGRLVQLIKSSSNRSQTPSEIKAVVSSRKPRFSGYGQQDAQQFLLALLELLSSELNRSKNPKYKELKADLKKNSLYQISEEWWNYNRERENSIICDYFAGQILSKVVCKRCSNQSIAFDNTWDFCLNFSSNDNGDIMKMIENFLKEETIAEDYYCSNCKDFKACTRKLFLYRIPQILVLQIKRFSYGKYSKQKMNNRIKAPTTLNLSRFISNNTSHPNIKSSVYDLVGVVNHSGEINYGHYTAECKNPINGKWYNFNDSSVTQTTMYDQLDSSSPYLLFYYRK